MFTRSSATIGKNTRDWLEFLGKRNYTAHDFVPEATRTTISAFGRLSPGPHSQSRKRSAYTPSPISIIRSPQVSPSDIGLYHLTLIENRLYIFEAEKCVALSFLLKALTKC